jgi:hypothetical protein
MPQIMQSKVRQFGVLQQLLKLSPHVALVQRSPDTGRENEPGLDPTCPGQASFRRLLFLMVLKRFDNECWKSDPTTALFTLRLDEPDVVSYTLKRLTDTQGSAVEIYIRPAQTQKFAET